MSRRFNSRKDLHPTKLERMLQILVSFRELCDSMLSSLHTFDNVIISASQKEVVFRQSRVQVHETPN